MSGILPSAVLNSGEEGEQIEYKFLQKLCELYRLLTDCFSCMLSEQMYLMRLHRCYSFSKAGDQNKISKEIFNV